MPDANPVVATVTRAGRPESIHRGFGAMADREGKVRAGFGDFETPVFWRSAAKPFQVLPFLEAGGAREFGLTTEEIALSCASHDGEPRHVETAAGLLRKGGFAEADLKCGTHPPYDERSAAAILRAGASFTPLHNNCSGKHAAMLLACRLLGLDAKTYDSPDHPLQRRILAKVAFYSMFPEDRIEIGIDGCSLPVFRLPLSRLATAYARLVAPESLPGENDEAFRGRRAAVGAMIAAPFFVAGCGQFTTKLIEAGAGRWLGKEGAEGVYAIGLASSGRGLAFKIDDGGARARPAVAVDLLAKAEGLSGAMPAALAEFVRPPVRNVRGTPVGEILADAPLAELA